MIPAAALVHSPSVRSVCHVHVNPSIARVDVSGPVSVVGRGGIPAAIIESTREMSATFSRFPSPPLPLSAGSVRTIAHVASNP